MENHKFNDLFTDLLSKCFKNNCQNPRQFIVQELTKDIGGNDEITALKTEIAALRQQLNKMKQHRDSFEVSSSELPAIVDSNLPSFLTEKSFDKVHSMNDTKKNAAASDDKNSIVSDDNMKSAVEETNDFYELFNTSDDDNDVDTSISNNAENDDDDDDDDIMQ